MSQQTDTSIGQFENSLQKLEAIVEKMDGGELSLEASLACFEEGIALTRACQSALTQVDQKIQILLEESETLSDLAFDDDQEDEEV